MYKQKEYRAVPHSSIKLSLYTKVISEGGGSKSFCFEIDYKDLHPNYFELSLKLYRRKNHTAGW